MCCTALAPQLCFTKVPSWQLWAVLSPRPALLANGNQVLFAAFRSEIFMLLDVCEHVMHFSILIDTLPTASRIC